MLFLIAILQFRAGRGKNNNAGKFVERSESPTIANFKITYAYVYVPIYCVKFFDPLQFALVSLGVTNANYNEGIFCILSSFKSTSPGLYSRPIKFRSVITEFS